MIAVTPSARRCFLYSLVFVIPLLGGVGAEAATYYVGKTGSDAVSCAAAQTLDTPKLTIASGISCMDSGDTLYIRAGTYEEVISSSKTTIPRGTSWAAPTKIWGYPGETVIIQPSLAYYAVHISQSLNWYLHLKDFVVDGRNMIHSVSPNPSTSNVKLGSSDESTTAFIRLENLEVRNAVGSAIHLNGHDFELLNMSVHHNGLVAQQMGYGPGSNGVYGMAWNSVVRGGIFHNNQCFGVRFFTSYPSGTGHDNLVTGATFYDNGAGKAFGGISTCSSGGGGVVMGDADNVASNNIMYDNVKGIWLYKSPSATNNNAVYNNTIYNNTYGIIVGSADVTNSIIKNNLLAGNTKNNYIDAGSGTIADNNRITGLITDCTISTTNFRLKTSAPCIDAGATISTVTSDFAGRPRPQGATHDIGAYEGSGPDMATPEAPRGLTIR